MLHRKMMRCSIFFRVCNFLEVCMFFFAVLLLASVAIAGFAAVTEI